MISAHCLSREFCWWKMDDAICVRSQYTCSFVIAPAFTDWLKCIRQQSHRQCGCGEEVQSILGLSGEFLHANLIPFSYCCKLIEAGRHPEAADLLFQYQTGWHTFRDDIQYLLVPGQLQAVSLHYGWWHINIWIGKVNASEAYPSLQVMAFSSVSSLSWAEDYLEVFWALVFRISWTIFLYLNVQWRFLYVQTLETKATTTMCLQIACKWDHAEIF